MAILNKIYLSLSLLLALTVLSGCYQDFDPEIKSSPVVCMNSPIAAGDSIKVRLTRTWAWNEGIPGETVDIDIPEAEVRLYVNGKYQETLEPAWVNIDYDRRSMPHLQYYHPGFKAMDYIPKPGDEIRLEAHTEKYGDAESTVRLPEVIKIDKVDMEVKNFNHYVDSYGQEISNMDLDLKVWFTDPVGNGNYYQFDVDCTPYNRELTFLPDHTEILQWRYADLSEEPIFIEHVSSLESVISETWGYSFFSDRQIDGKSYPLRLSIEGLTYIYQNSTGRPDMGNMALELNLTALSEAYYKHILSIWESNDGIAGSLGSVGLGEMVYTHSNVSTGAGMVAGSTTFTYSIPMQDLVKQLMAK